MDAYHLPSSPLLDPSPDATSTSFGGDGEGSCGFVPPTRPDPALCCVAAGPSVDLRPRYLNGDDQPHCLNRHFSNVTAGDGWNGQAYAEATIANITANNTVFETFWQALESGPHGAVHGAVGGDMVPSTSPNVSLPLLPALGRARFKQWRKISLIQYSQIRCSSCTTPR